MSSSGVSDSWSRDLGVRRGRDHQLPLSPRAVTTRAQRARGAHVAARRAARRRGAAGGEDVSDRAPRNTAYPPSSRSVRRRTRKASTSGRQRRSRITHGRSDESATRVCRSGKWRRCARMEAPPCRGGKCSAGWADYQTCMREEQAKKPFQPWLRERDVR